MFRGVEPGRKSPITDEQRKLEEDIVAYWKATDDEGRVIRDASLPLESPFESATVGSAPEEPPPPAGSFSTSLDAMVHNRSLQIGAEVHGLSIENSLPPGDR